MTEKRKLPWGYMSQRSFFMKAETMIALKKLDNFFHGTRNVYELVNTAIIEFAKRTVKEGKKNANVESQQTATQG